MNSKIDRCIVYGGFMIETWFDRNTRSWVIEIMTNAGIESAQAFAKRRIDTLDLPYWQAAQ